MIQENIVSDSSYFASLHDLFASYQTSRNATFELDRESSLMLLTDTGHAEADQVLEQLNCKTLTISKYFEFAKKNPK